jgi:hypothetical protein
MAAPPLSHASIALRSSHAVNLPDGGKRMTTDDALLFIDANKYLDLYRTKTGKLSLAALSQQADHIFVTQKVVDEVRRNKIKETAVFLMKDFKELAKSETYNVPDHLSGRLKTRARASYAR